MVPKLMHDRNAHLANQLVTRPERPLEGTTKDRDLIGQNHRVSVAALRERNAFVQTEEHLPRTAVAAKLRVGRPVFDDNVDVVEHLQHVVRQPVQGVRHQPFELPLTMTLDAFLDRSAHTK